MIGSYVYHLDVIVATMQSNVNKYKVSSTYYYKVYCCTKPYNMHCDPQSLILLYDVDAVEFRTRMLIQGIELLYIVKGQWTPG